MTAVAKKQSALSVGNILGANILDLTLILPVSALISGKPLPIAQTAAHIDHIRSQHYACGPQYKFRAIKNNLFFPWVGIMVAIFLAGIILILKGGNFFVDAASWIAEASGIPKLIIGATIVSVATTLPEMLVSMMAAAQGKADMSVGNAVGSVQIF